MERCVCLFILLARLANSQLIKKSMQAASKIPSEKFRLTEIWQLCRHSCQISVNISVKVTQICVISHRSRFPGITHCSIIYCSIIYVQSFIVQLNIVRLYIVRLYGVVQFEITYDPQHYQPTPLSVPK